MHPPRLQTVMGRGDGVRRREGAWPLGSLLRCLVRGGCRGGGHLLDLDEQGFKLCVTTGGVGESAKGSRQVGEREGVCRQQSMKDDRDVGIRVSAPRASMGEKLMLVVVFTVWGTACVISLLPCKICRRSVC